MQNKSESIIELTQKLEMIRTDYWVDEVLFSFNWWLLVMVTIGLFVVWFIVLDKNRILDILPYGLMVAVTGATLDILGASLHLWQYRYTLTPVLLPGEIHIIQMPILFMIIYQYWRTWKAFLIASTINAFIFAFVLEQLLIWLQIYKPFVWKSIYSFLMYIVIAVVFKMVITKFKRLDRHYHESR